VAVLVVVAFHAGLPVPGGFIGVDIFFVVSGFVITAMLEREWERSGRIRFGNFYLRRFKRLTPALALMVAVTVVLSVLFVSPLGPQQAAGETAIGAMMLVANIVIATSTGGYFDAKAETNPLLHTWSLSVEEQFYLIFPALILLGWSLARKHSFALIPFLNVAGVAALSFALAVAGSRGMSVPGFSRILGFYSPLTRAWEFAAGALLALALARWGPTSQHAFRLLGAIGLGVVIVSVLVITERTPFPGVWTLLPVAGTLLLLLAGTSATGPTFQMLASRPMVRIGDWSYSIYLWHWPFIAFAGLLWGRSGPVLLGAAATSFIPAIISYRWVEQPIRSLGALTPRRWGGLAAAVVVLPVFLGSGLSYSSSNGWWSQPVRRLQAATIPLHVATVDRCDKRQPLSSAVTSRCTWNANAGGKPIYLLGDSNASQFSEGTIQAGDELHRPVVIGAAVGCPFVDVFIDTPPPSDKAICRRYFEGTLEYLQHAPAGVVVIANIDTYWSFDSIEAGSSPGSLSSDPAQKLAALRSGLRRTVEALHNAGHQVLLVQTIPHVKWDPSRCGLLVIMREQCTAQTTLESAIEPGLAARSLLLDVARGSNADIWDPVRPLCPAGACSTEAPSLVRYRDSAHVSVPQSVALAPDIRDAIASVVEQHS
jgi:peptidoglycan/LPS O-acetylase OafA/YrhL